MNALKTNTQFYAVSLFFALTSRLTIKLLLLVIIFNFGLFSQRIIAQPKNTYIKDVILEAPNAASFARYGDIPVSNLTGVPNISVPIHTVQYGSLSVPISLSYHASGIRVADNASWVGTGWSLNAGGVISRTVAGNIDEETGGYISTGSSLNSYLTGSELDELTQTNPTKDAEPDIFSFNVGGYTGKFVIDKNGKVNLIPQQDVKIWVNHVSGNVPSTITSTGINGFTLIAPNGTKYIFGSKTGIPQQGRERSRPKNGGKSSIPYYSSWYLIRIESVDNNHVIDFNYTTEIYQIKSPASSSITKEITVDVDVTGSNYIDVTSSNGQASSNGGHNYNTNEITGVRLSSITTPFTNINFVATNTRLDLDYTGTENLPKSLSEIQITSGQHQSKYILYHTYFQTSTNTHSPTTAVRLKLDSVAQRSSDVYIGSHKFNYNGDLLPDRLSKSIDHWGYYNGANNNSSLTNIPPTTLKLYSLVGNNYDFTQGDAIRNVDTNFVQKGVLTKVEYPTGGYTEFEYESNTAMVVPSLVTTDQQTPLFGMEANDTNDTQEEIKTFTAQNINTGFLEFTLTGSVGTVPRARLTVMRQSNSKVLFRMTVKNTTGNLYKYRIPLKKLRAIDGETLIAAENYKITLIYQTTDVTETANAYFTTGTVPPAPIPVSTPVGGLRIKKTNSYESATSTPIVKEYSYLNADGNTSGILTTYPLYGYTDVYWKLTGSGLFAVTYTHWESNSVTSLTDFGGNHIAYECVKVSSPNNGHSVYKHSVNLTSSTEVRLPVVPELFDETQGQIISEEHFNQDNQLVSKTTTEYVATDRPLLEGNFYRVLVTGGSSNANFGGKYYAKYILLTGKTQVLRRIEILDNISKTTEYEYYTNPEWTVSPKAVITSNSDNAYHKSVTTYAHEEGLTNMIGRNMIAIPIKTEQYIKKQGQSSYQLLGGSKTIYEDVNSIPKPKHFESLKRDGNWQTDFTMDEYFPDGFPKRATMAGYNQSEHYTWENKLLKKKIFGNVDADSRLEWNYNYETNTALLESIVDENQLIKKFEYDDFARLKKVKDRVNPTNAADVQSITDFLYYYKNSPTTSNSVTTSSTFVGVSNTIINKQYFDGLGRPTQSVKENYTPDNQHQINTVTYDASGRQKEAYTPYKTGMNLSEIPYSYPTYEASPLSRVIRQDFKDPNVLATDGINSYNLTSYGTNTGTEVKMFIVTGGNSGASYTFSYIGNYAINTLFKTTFRDENKSKDLSTKPSSDIFKDKLGRVVLTRKYILQVGSTTAYDNVDTYNIYDDYGQLVAVIPPDAINSSNQVDVNLTFQYKYDNENRLIEKKIPSADWQKFYYDARDLLSLTQDGNMRDPLLGGNANKYLGTKYDDFGRVVKTGWVTTSTPLSTALNITITETDKLTENIYYPNKSWIKHSGAKVLKPTGVSTARDFVWSYIERREGLTYTGNPIWTGKQHLLYNDGNNGPINDWDSYGVDWSVSGYDGAQKPTLSIRYLFGDPNSGSQEVRTLQEYAYDNGQRLSNHTYSYGLFGDGFGTHSVQLSNMVYNYKDQMKEKNTALVAGKYLQSTDFDYNSKGWLTSINKKLF